MSELTVTTREGDEIVLSGEDGLSVMEVIRDGGLDQLLAMCGGCCSCATCHVYVDEKFLSDMPTMTDDENDLLESSSHRQANSRLACQIPFTSALHRARVAIAPED